MRRLIRSMSLVAIVLTVAVGCHPIRPTPFAGFFMELDSIPCGC